MKVHILGAGPAGLLAAHAAKERALDFRIHSIKVPSDIKGAQFLHERVNGVTTVEPDVMIEFQKWGHPEGYAEKVYGDPEAPTSWDEYPEGEVAAWGMVETYAKLWEMYEWFITDTEIRAPYIDDLLAADDDSIVISTITPQGYCLRDDHEFKWQEVWIDDVCSAPTVDLLDNVVIYNGSKSEAWYRTSMIMGHGSTEYSSKPDHIHKKSRKPLGTTCDCYGTDMRFHRVGRFGKFEKGQLVSDAYNDAQEILDALL